MTTKHETFSIGDTARMTGVSQKQLRHWEAREFISAAYAHRLWPARLQVFYQEAGGTNPSH